MKNTRKHLTRDEFVTIIRDGGATDDVIVLKEFVAEVKEVEGGERQIEFAITTEDVDRDGDTISLDGWTTDNYQKNPVVLWAHNYYEPPVGKSLQLDADSSALRSVAQFTSRDLYPFGYMIYEMLREGFLNAVSVGFLPSDWEERELEEGEDGDQYFWMPLNFLKQDLLEYSVVPVPSNPNALQLAAAKGIDLRPLGEWVTRALDKDPELFASEQGKYLWVPRQNLEACQRILTPSTQVAVPPPGLTQAPTSLDDFAKTMTGTILAGSNDSYTITVGSSTSYTPETPPEVTAEQKEEPEVESETKGPIEGHETDTVDSEWDAGEAVGNAKSDEDFAYYARIFGWYDDSADETLKGSYKFPHHMVSAEGDPGAANTKACVAAIAALNGARGGANIPDGDRKGVWDHVARHMRDAEMEPPELRDEEAPVEEWSDEEVAAFDALGLSGEDLTGAKELDTEESVSDSGEEMRGLTLTIDVGELQEIVSTLNESVTTLTREVEQLLSALKADHKTGGDPGGSEPVAGPEGVEVPPRSCDCDHDEPFLRLADDEPESSGESSQLAEVGDDIRAMVEAAVKRSSDRMRLATEGRLPD